MQCILVRSTLLRVALSACSPGATPQTHPPTPITTPLASIATPLVLSIPGPPLEALPTFLIFFTNTNSPPIHPHCAPAPPHHSPPGRHQALPARPPITAPLAQSAPRPPRKQQAPSPAAPAAGCGQSAGTLPLRPVHTRHHHGRCRCSQLLRLLRWSTHPLPPLPLHQCPWLLLHPLHLDGKQRRRRRPLGCRRWPSSAL